MKILVTFALDNEFAPWRAMHDFRPGRWGNVEAYFAEINGAEVGVVLTGVGPETAGVRASGVIWSESDSIGVCISSGLTGGLKKGVAIGEVLAARMLRTASVHSDLNSNNLDCTKALVSFAEEMGATVVSRFFTSQQAIVWAGEKRRLSDTADAVDMESFEIVKEAVVFGIPAIAIRAVSDLADEDLPLDMNEVFTEQGKVSVPRVLGQIARHPGSLRGLMRLGLQSKAASEALARFLDRYVATVAERSAVLNARGAA